jgi:nicotinamide riboside transporter PnuC
MRRTESDVAELERWLAGLLHYGTWVAASTVAAGLAMALPGPWARSWPFATGAVAAHVMTAGIALFILLPIMRLILMLGAFVHQRDYRFGAIAALVLVIVVAGSMIGAT